MESVDRVVLDDRLLIEHLLVGLDATNVELYTTAYWYYRACRAAVAGAGGQLSGPFEHLDRNEQERAILSLLELPDDIGLPEPRASVPAMARVAVRQPRLNLLNLEAVAAGETLDATIWLSAPAASGLLPAVLDAEAIPWTTITIA
ncbi:MAG: hypothetical protein H0X61_04045 [Acidimicrobiia bacterium]|jgi:hypothetical protein|nr:hypothetical protein [Acidimicrobiia bacterium]MBA3982693.1 hypothetical protein [Acidimicrobiia bacterium]MDQ3391765.1 hypothetical protein [Actinomycetota bacterium]